MALQWAKIRMIRWMCRVKVTDRFMCSDLREIPGIGDIITLAQRNMLRWCGHVSRRDKNDWLKNTCIMKWKA